MPRSRKTRITFHVAPIAYTFDSIEEAKAYFGVPDDIAFEEGLRSMLLDDAIIIDFGSVVAHPRVEITWDEDTIRSRGRPFARVSY